MLNAINVTTWFDQGSFQYFIDLTRQILRQRKVEEEENEKVKRNDFVQLMVDSFVYDQDLADQDYDKLTATNASKY